MMKKTLAAVLSAAVIAFGCIAPAFTSTAATLTPDDNNSRAGMNGSGVLVTTGVNPLGVTTDMWGLALGSSATYDSIAADQLAKTITFKNFNAGNCVGINEQSELYVGAGADGYTLIFDGDCSFRTFDVDGTFITVSLTPGSTLSCATWFAGVEQFIALADGTTINPATFVGNQPITFSGEGEADADEEDTDEAEADGEEEFVLTQEMIDEILKYISTLMYENHMKEFSNDLLQAAYNATLANPQVLYFAEGDSLPSQVFAILKANPNVSIVFHYTYKGQTYQLWISGAQAAKYFDETITWYGPEWLAAHFPADTSGLYNY